MIATTSRQQRTSTRVGRAAALAVAGVLLLASCDLDRPAREQGTGSPVSTVTTPYPLRVLAGTELKDMTPLLEEARKATGVTVELSYKGTLEGIELVAKGAADRSYDAIWFSSNRYLALQPRARDKLGSSSKIMSSPVLLGLRASVASRLGWDTRSVSWADIAAAASKRKFTYGMTNPATSNSGFSAVVAVATALSGSGDPIEAAQVERVMPGLRGFFSAQTLTARSSDPLSEEYLRRAAGAPGRPPVDGLLTYESELLSLNASGKLPEPFTLIYPSDGVVSADYPLTLLTSAPEAARSAFRRLTDHLRTRSVQAAIMDRTHRRPVIPNLALSDQFSGQQPYELPFPATGDVLERLLVAYTDRLRPPARTIYVLDTSGSMAGQRLADLRKALTILSAGDRTLASRFDRFRGREQVTLLPFSAAPMEPVTFNIPEQDPQPALDRIRAYATRLRANGWTAIYDALVDAYDIARQQTSTDRSRSTSIVLMSDGENNRGRNLNAFRQFYRHLPPRLRGIPVFPVLFGESNVAEMRQLARLTGGGTFDARTRSLARAFRDIRGDQ